MPSKAAKPRCAWSGVIRADYFSLAKFATNEASSTSVSLIVTLVFVISSLLFGAVSTTATPNNHLPAT